MTKSKSLDKIQYSNIWNTLKHLRDVRTVNNTRKLVVSKFVPSYDGLNWKTVWNMLDVLFTGPDVEILVCYPNGRENGRLLVLSDITL